MFGENFSLHKQLVGQCYSIPFPDSVFHKIVMRLIYILIIGLHEVYNLIKLNAAHMVKMPGLVVV